MNRKEKPRKVGSTINSREKISLNWKGGQLGEERGNTCTPLHLEKIFHGGKDLAKEERAALIIKDKKNFCSFPKSSVRQERK